MHTLKRSIRFIGKRRIVDGIEVPWDADVGILLERRSYLEIIKNYLDIRDEDLIVYSQIGWDRDIFRYKLSNGAVVVFTHAGGPAYAASGVERLVRTGVSHVVRIGSCGSLDALKLPKWNLLIANDALAHESVTAFNGGDVVTGYNLSLGKVGLSKRVVSSSVDLSNLVFSSFAKSKEVGDKVVMSRIYTNSTRYLEDVNLMKSLKEHVGVVGVDMETSAIYSVASFHKIEATSISIAMDEPVDENKLLHAKSELNSIFHGSTDYNIYEKTVPKLLKNIVDVVLSVFLVITSNSDYKLLVDTRGKFNGQVE